VRIAREQIRDIKAQSRRIRALVAELEAGRRIRAAAAPGGRLRSLAPIVSRPTRSWPGLRASLGCRGRLAYLNGGGPGRSDRKNQSDLEAVRHGKARTTKSPAVSRE
jgi:hypothetical protein